VAGTPSYNPPMRCHYLRSSLLALGLLLGGLAGAADLPGPRDALFVGNSFTYYNNGLHHHYRELVRATADDGSRRVRSQTISGGYLPEHDGALGTLLREQSWDVVVLQGYSRGPIEDASAPAFRDAARRYAERIRLRGAEPVFFMTWAYTSRPEMTEPLAAAYTSIGRELGARVAPVGLAFATVRAERPDLPLITGDDKHPTPAGTYLAACTFYALLHGVSPEGNPYLADLPEGVAGYLQRVAWATVGAYEQPLAD